MTPSPSLAVRRVGSIGERPAFAAAAIVLLLTCFAATQALGLWLAWWYERQAVLAGSVWRLLTAHLAHLGWTHALLNASGLLLCAVLTPALFSRPVILSCRLLVLGLGVSLGLLLVSPQITHYAGFSGVLYGLLVMGLAPQAARRDVLAALALLCVVGWMGWQMLAGPSVDEEALIGGAIVAQAHARGVAVALGWMLLESAWQGRGC